VKFIEASEGRLYEKLEAAEEEFTQFQCDGKIVIQLFGCSSFQSFISPLTKTVLAYIDTGAI
jgi:hypothetical protein